VKKAIALIFLFLNVTPLFSQQKSFEIIGVIVDQSSQAPIPFATVVVLDNTSLDPITGVTTAEDGSFSVRSPYEDIYVEISFIGYETLKRQDFQVNGALLDLGKIALSEQSEMLNEVEVRGEKSTMEFKLDKRVFNVGKDLSSTGASALEVLDNVPSVTVSIEGQVRLRGNAGVQILINGKPSVLTSEGGNALGSITAEMIDKVEVITNPSAKYEAEGTAGIINIVIKKDERKGINGSFTLNYGQPDNNSFGLSLNRRTEKFNLFTQIGYGSRSYPREGKNKNDNRLTNTQVLTEGTQYRNEKFYNIILGTDYYINPQNVITLSGFYAFEAEDQPSNTNVKQYNNIADLTSEWNRKEVTTADNPKYQYEFIYKRDFLDDEDHDLIFSATGNLFSKDQSSEFFNTTVLGSDTFDDQQTRTFFREAEHIFKLDYTHPFGEVWKVEGGFQYANNDVSNDFEVKDDLASQWVVNSGLTNVFEFTQGVLGVYGMAAYESDTWGAQLGLRTENTKINTLLVNTEEENEQNFTDLFPSLNTSYKFSQSFSLQAGYSRRIYRPRLWELNPFFNIRNSYNYRKGNPNLRSEYSDSYEISAIFLKGISSLNMSLYQLYTTNTIESVTTFQDNISVSGPENLGSKRVNGIEINGKITPSKKIIINGDFNYNAFDRKATWQNRSFDFKGNSWSSEITSKFKFPKDLDVEMSWNYQSGFKTIDGESGPSQFFNLGARKKLLKGKGVVSLNIRDLFATRVRENETIRDNFNIWSRSVYGRFWVIGFSYGFGKGEAMEFRSRRR
jgi:outer membrane receptor protein involved in Fe transport